MPLKLIRGTTPRITVKVKNDIDLHILTEVWVYISQQNKVKVDKTIDDVSFNYEENKIYVPLTQDDTLALKKGDALIQVRALTNGEDALGMNAKSVEVIEVYKGGVIKADEEENTNG